MKVPQVEKMFCLFVVVGSQCKNLVGPAKLGRWIPQVLGPLVLVIVEISVEDQHPETCSIEQLFCVISTYVERKNQISIKMFHLCFIHSLCQWR